MEKGNSRSALFLTELIIAILIFALSMGICGALFVHSFTATSKSTNLNNAVFLASSAAEAFHAYDDPADIARRLGGFIPEDGTDDTVIVYYDKDWNVSDSPDGAVFTLVASLSEDGAVETADISITEKSGWIIELVASKNNMLRGAGE
jgi:hypothetical protein